MDPYTPLGCIFALGHDSFICFETLLRLSHRCRKVCWCMSLFLLSDMAAQVITVWNCLSPLPHVHPGLLPNFISPILLAEHNSTSLCIYDSREIGQETSCGDSAASGEHGYEPPTLHWNPFSARGKWLNGPWSCRCTLLMLSERDFPEEHPEQGDFFTPCSPVSSSQASWWFREVIWYCSVKGCFLVKRYTNKSVIGRNCLWDTNLLQN